MSFALPVPLTVAHLVENFDCGRESLNLYLKRFALTNIAAGTARTYVATQSQSSTVIGYYSLAAGSVQKAQTPPRVAKGIPNYPVSVVLLARLAVDVRFQNKGLGQGLLRDALLRAVSASDIIGIRAILVHAKDVNASAFYGRFGFSPSPSDPLHMMLLIKDLKRTLKIL